MNIHYLEIVTEQLDSTCAAYQGTLGVTFYGPVEQLGNARLAKLDDGSMIGVRLPMHESEEPTIRPYWLVDNIEEAISAAKDSGADVIHPALEIPGYGIFAIYLIGGNQHALWQL